MSELQLGDSIVKPCRRSRKIIDLKVRIAELAVALQVDKNLIPQVQAEIDRLHAFRVLMHAEVQHYLESVVIQILDVTENEASVGRITHAGHHLLIFQAMNPLATPRTSAKASYPQFALSDLKSNWSATSTSLIKAIDGHRKRVKGNNGIKVGNMNTILLPVGFRDTFFTSYFRDKMDELGEQRGRVAHGSGALVSSIPTGRGELQRFLDIEPGLSLADRYVPRLLQPLW
ncbi:hypothetical protein OG543_14125 [Streptomyces sp. NBC_01178]|uniref:hypothetical protein n=1 Tax=Streptomyces sp. NBC_01178 TaxID=2903762 RepID=UPI003864FF03|nr:hypothetical protein OG543_14125 [Streptomyces sp. NBC_01178]